MNISPLFGILRRGFFLSLLQFSFSITTVSGQNGDSTSAKRQSDISADSNEFIDIGYGLRKKNRITGAVTHINSADFNHGYILYPEQLIQGRVAGLSISKPGGDPNSSFYLRMRGLSTLYGNNQPLMVIDGIIGASVENLDPNDIESITVIKDGAGAAIYGIRGSAGVILITTKKGKPGTIHVEYSGYVTAEMVAKNTPVMDAEEWRFLSDEIGKGTDFGESTDWFDKIEQTALSHHHHLAFSSGTDKTSYRASVNYRDGQGVQINTGYSTLNGRINLTQKAWKDRITFDIQAAGTTRQSRMGFNEVFKYAGIFNPTAPVKSSDINHVNSYDGYFQNEIFDNYNPVAIAELDKNEGKDRVLNLSMRGSLNILKGLSLDAFYSMQSQGSLSGRHYDKYEYWGGHDGLGFESRSIGNFNNRLFEASACLNRELGHMSNLNILGLYSFQEFTNERSLAEGGEFVSNDFSFRNRDSALEFTEGHQGTSTNFLNRNRLIAFMGRAQLSIKNTWNFTGTARYEGSSLFGSENKWGLLGSASAGVDIAKFVNINALDHLRLRMGYAVTGNQPKESYLSQYNLFGLIYGNEDLALERKREINLGFDFSTSGNKISGSIDYYNNTTSNLLNYYHNPYPPGGNLWFNLGKMGSSGIEFYLDYKMIANPGFSYKLMLNTSLNLTNRFISLSGTYKATPVDFGTRDLGDLGYPGQSRTPLARVEESRPVGELLALEFRKIDEDGNLVMVDQAGTSAGIDAADRRIVGNGLPKFFLGLGNNVTFRNWDLNVFFRGVFGHDLLNSFRALYEVPEMVSSYNLPNTAKDVKNKTTGAYLNKTAGLLSSYHIEDGDFVALDNASLGYSITIKENSGISGIRLYIAGNNLFYISKYKGADPNPRYEDESFTDSIYTVLVTGVDRPSTWCRTRSFSLGASLVF